MRPLERKILLTPLVLAWEEGLFVGPLVLAQFWTAAFGTALAVRLDLRHLFKLLGQELLVDPVQGVGDELGSELVDCCLKTHLRLECTPCSIECGAMMLSVHHVDLQ